mmetsp:Transcript_19256/g.50041  ORF Transcript_19256/g.50041 Transcript_19256/m.50041 type:complete len:479 (+) Transcript_19256:59-1495(+)
MAGQLSRSQREQMLRRRGSQGPHSHDKTIESGRSRAVVPGTVAYSHCSTKGMRFSMEDDVACMVDVLGVPASGFFGVFDGHGGAEVARYVAQALPARLLRKITPRMAPPPTPPLAGFKGGGHRGSGFLPQLSVGGGGGSSAGLSSTRMSPNQRRSAVRTATSISSSISGVARPTPIRTDEATVSAWPPKADTDLNATVRSALRDSFAEVDAQCREAVNAETCGTTACCVLLLEQHYAFCNAGDSRAVLVSGGKVVFSTTDHKPQDRRERTRIYGAGGYVFRGRVRGVLAVARALGDFAFKGADHLGYAEQEVTCAPDVVFVDRQPHRDEFIVVGCDGVWDVMSNVAVADLVAAHLARGGTAESAASALVDAALQRGSTDNITAIVIQFVDGSVRVRQPPAASSSLPPISKQKIEHRRELHRSGPRVTGQSASGGGGGAVKGGLDVEAVAAIQSLDSLDRLLSIELSEPAAEEPADSEA